MRILDSKLQFIKVDSRNREISKHDNIEKIILHTGELFDGNIFNIFGIYSVLFLASLLVLGVF